ncbi:ribokinase [Glutamicibacter creatinolyticus]|uniref:ribokinase n=1 Tax=Glutamicibacter creatinolyticus TaxID=162496 RepID=UPI0037C0507E
MAEDRQIQVTVVGSSNVDITALMARLPGPGQTVLADSYQLTPGGKGANQALAAQLAGAATEFIGAVGRDEHSAIALGQLADAGVTLQRVARTEQPTGVAIISVDARAENSIAVISGANAGVDAALVRSAGALHGVLVLQGEIPADGISAAIAASSGRVVLNLAPVIPLRREDLLAANPLVVNEHEAFETLAQLDPQTAAGLQGRYRQLAEALLAQGVASVVITLGGDGCLVAEAGGSGTSSVHEVPALEVKAVDTTGAGDAFTGALAAKLAAGQPLLEAARFASRFAASTVQRPGAQASYPRDLSGI